MKLGQGRVHLLFSRHVAVLEVVPHVIDELDHRLAPSLLALGRIRLVAKRERTRGKHDAQASPSSDKYSTDAAALLLEKKIGRLLVVDDDDKLVGLLSCTDMMALVLSGDLEM